MASRIRETIIECLREAQQYSGSNNEHDHDEDHLPLQTLVTLTKISPHNRNALSQIDGAVASLVDLSKWSSPRVQVLAFSVLFNLSLNPNLKHSLAQTDATILYLNDVILSSKCMELNKLAASLLCSLAMLDKNKAKFGVLGTIQVLVKAISGPWSPATHHLLSSLAELVQFHGNCMVAVRSGAIPVLLSIAESDNREDLIGTSLAILGLLARFEEGLNELKRTERVIARMIGVLERGCMVSKEGACEILLRLFNESEGCMRDAVGMPQFSTVVADVSVRGSVGARVKAEMLMKKIMDSKLY